MKNFDQLSVFKHKALQWASGFDICFFLDSNQYGDQYGEYDVIIAAGAQKIMPVSEGSAFGSLQKFYDTHKQWIFGFFGYDLKNETEQLHSENPDNVNFPDAFFFIPEYVVAAKNKEWIVISGPDCILAEINNVQLTNSNVQQINEIKKWLSKEAYINKVEKLKAHILRGDIYEINFCQEFFSEHAVIDPVQTFETLNKLSPTPFAGFVKYHDRYILSASPERFMRKQGNTLFSQPIKGTARRSKDSQEDERIKQQLKADIKEQAENVMIVDLVRHDLTKSAVKGTVKVEELFGIYSFAQVHQMISTISCELNPDIHFIDAIKNAFPMGSMTGAPKVKAMKLIEQYEVSKRGIYSGSFGYITPGGDFDFNVVIRSILYNSNAGYLSFQVGSAITYESDAQKEYDECLLKASAILKVLGH